MDIPLRWMIQGYPKFRKPHVSVLLSPKSELFFNEGLKHPLLGVSPLGLRYCPRFWQVVDDRKSALAWNNPQTFAGWIVLVGVSLKV